MKKRVVVGLILIVALVAAFAFRLIETYGLYIFDLFIGAICIFCAIEASNLLSKCGNPTCQIAAGLYPSFMFAGHMFYFIFSLDIYVYIIIQLSILLVAFSIVFISYLFINSKETILYKKQNNIGRFKLALLISSKTFLTFIYPSFMLLCLMILNRIDAFGGSNILLFGGNLGWILLAAAFMIPIFSDTFAMLGGMAFKGPKLCKKISPNKTISGSVTSILATSLLMGGYYYLLTAFSSINSALAGAGVAVWMFAVLGFFGSIVCQAGDLFESKLKRRANVKDSGNIFPGHGGFLDRLDSHIFNAPFVLIFAILAIII